MSVLQVFGQKTEYWTNRNVDLMTALDDITKF